MRELAMIKDPDRRLRRRHERGTSAHGARPRYEEDSKAEVDMNFVKTGDGRFIEPRARLRARPSTAARSTR
jgi:hypothetical protein